MTPRVIACLDKHDSADDSDAEAEQHARIVSSIRRATEERRDLSGWCTVSAIATLWLTRRSNTGAGSSSGVSDTAARTAVGGR